MPNSFNVAPQPKKTDSEQAANYFNDFSQFGGEWQEPVSRSTNKERGAKVAKSAGFTFSYGEMPMDNQSYTVTETWNSIGTSLDTTKQRPAVSKNQDAPSVEKPTNATTEASVSTDTALQANAKSVESPGVESSNTSKPFADRDNSDINENTSIAAERTKLSEPYIPEEPRSFSQMDARRQALIDELIPPNAHIDSALTADSSKGRSGSRAGRHFANETYEKRWTREPNYKGSHFADESEIQYQYDRYTREEPSARGERFREEEPKTKGGRHFAEEPKSRRWLREEESEPGRHFRAEQEKNNLLRNVLNKVKKSKGFKSVVSIALAGVMAFSLAGNFAQNSRVSAMEADAFEQAVQATQHEDSGGGETEQQYNVLTGYEALDKLIDGSFEQDDNPGCYEADGKVSPDAVANPNQVFEMMGVDPANATADDYGKAFEYIAYSMKYPAAYIAVTNGFDGFKGLSTTEAEKKIASMSKEEKQNFQNTLKDTFNRTTYSLENASGVYRNYGISGEGSGRHSYFVETNLDNTMLLAAKTVDADGGYTISYSKANCDNPVDFIVRYDSAGNYEVEIVNTTETPSENPTPSETPETPPETIKPKDSENLQRIDRDILDQVAEEIQTGQVKVTPNPGVSENDLTDAPADDAYEGTSPTIVQNNPSQNATPVEEDISDENEYTENRGGANMGEYSPVQENPDADAAANNRNDTVSNATGGDIGDALANDGVDLG